MDYNHNVQNCEPIVRENLVVNSTELYAGAVVSLTCKDDLKLEGPSVLICGENSAWSDLWPFCKNPEKDDHHNQAVIIAVCSIASIVALAILIFSLYMLISHLRKEKKNRNNQKRIEENIKDIRIFQAVSMDCVGMPALVHDNMHSSLRGKPQASVESSRATSQTDLTESQMDLATEKAIIF